MPQTPEAKAAPPFNEYADAVNIDTIEQEIRGMEVVLVSMHAGNHSPYTDAALKDTRSYSGKLESRQKIREESRQTVMEAEQKMRDELMRKYKPLLDEELVKIELQFPASGSKLAKEKLIKFRHEIFHRRIKIELEKMKLTEWAPKEALAESQLKVSIASPRGARVYTQATECFSSTWTPRSTAGSVLLS
jgi:hypothetical protein